MSRKVGQRNWRQLHTFMVGVLAFTWAHSSLQAEDSPRETMKVERVKINQEKRPSLRFLRDNKDFLRGQLDLLRQIYGLEMDGRAIALDARHLELQRLMEELLASLDAARTGNREIADRGLLESVVEIAWLESELDRIDEILRLQESRLAWLDEDFTGRQETALMVLLRGVPDGEAPESIVLMWSDEKTVRVPIDQETWGSLRMGGVAKIYHEFIEPREHDFRVGMEGGAWTMHSPLSVPIEPARDRITFLELSLTGMSSEITTSGVASKIWVR